MFWRWHPRGVLCLVRRQKVVALKGPAYGCNSNIVKFGNRGGGKEIFGVPFLMAIVAMGTSIEISRGLLEGVHGGIGAY